MDVEVAACLGKVPTHQEFVRCRASTPTMRALDDWIRKGLHHARKNGRPDWEESYDAGSARRFVMCQKGKKVPNLLFGVVAPSRDKRGRTYPFVVTCEVPKHAVSPQHYAYLPVQAASFFQEADRLVQRASQGDVSYKKVLNRVQQLRIEVAVQPHAPRRHKRYLREQDLGTFLEQQFGHFEDSEKYQLFSSLLERLLPLRDQAEPHLSAGLQFPLLSDEEQCAGVVAFWLETVLRLLDFPSVLPSLFWSSPACPSTSDDLLIYMGGPGAQSFFDIMASRHIEGNICTLSQAGERTSAEAALSIPAKYGQLLEDEEIPLWEFLRCL